MIRLQRVGRTNDPSYRVVVTEKTNSTKSGRFLEIVGSYDARHKDKIDLKTDRITHWIAKGAQTTGTLHNILVGAKIVKGPRRDVSPRTKKVDVKAGVAPATPTSEKKEAEKVEVAPPEEKAVDTPVEATL